MFRAHMPLTWFAFCFPHARGDVPSRVAFWMISKSFSPRPWGCSVRRLRRTNDLPVFPTPVGMFRDAPHLRARQTRFPHARGDVPCIQWERPRQKAFSPRPWGCSLFCHYWKRRLSVFPTPVGMFRAPCRASSAEKSFPHARGDVPLFRDFLCFVYVFSPRPWGCSVAADWTAKAVNVFPTPVGMFRVCLGVAFRRRRFPHARGDVPARHVRMLRADRFSPRPWGCSVEHGFAADGADVFPTPVGMFRVVPSPLGASTCFPHARGDVPRIFKHGATRTEFSPRPWGCSANNKLRKALEDVFPTPVGMFRDV